MIDCNEAREILALEPTAENDAVQAHLATCVRCARYRRPQQALDVALRAEMHWEAPAALTAQLLALAAQGPAALVTPPAALRARPKRWYVITVYLLTATAIGLSLAVAWQFVGLLLLGLGAGAFVSGLAAQVSQNFDGLFQMLPLSHSTINFLLQLRQQLLWLLLVAVLWAVVDKWNPQFTLRREPVSS